MDLSPQLRYDYPLLTLLHPLAARSFKFAALQAELAAGMVPHVPIKTTLDAPPQGPIEDLIEDLKGKVVLITGASRGFGEMTVGTKQPLCH